MHEDLLGAVVGGSVRRPLTFTARLGQMSIVRTIATTVIGLVATAAVIIEAVGTVTTEAETVMTEAAGTVTETVAVVTKQHDSCCSMFLLFDALWRFYR